MTPEELVGILKKHQRYVQRMAGGVRADLKHQDLSGLKLPQVDLQEGTLTAVDFTD